MELGRELLQAVADGNMARLRELVVLGADVNASNENGATPLHRAAVCGNTVAVRVLVETGAQVNAQQPTGMRALHWAAERGHLQTMLAQRRERRFLEAHLSEAHECQLHHQRVVEGGRAQVHAEVGGVRTLGHLCGPIAVATVSPETQVSVV
jgi:ankyrin repeat protein